MDITSSFQSALDAVVNFLPKALAFLVILIVGWIIAKVLRKVITKLLARVGLDRVAERGGLRRFTGKYTVSELAGTLVYFAVLLLTLQLAFNAFGTNPVSDLLNALVAWLPHLFIAGVIMVVAFAIGNMIFEMISGAMSNMSYGRPMARAAQGLIIAVAAIAALNQIGIATAVTTPILVAALAMIVGVVVVGVGGGMIAPMRSRWERMLGAAEAETGKLSASRSDRQEGAQFGQPAYQSQYSQADQSQQAGMPQDVSAPSGQPQQSQQQPPHGQPPGHSGQI